MFGLLTTLQPGISPTLSIPPRISASSIPSFDPFKKVCPLSNDPGITMQIKYDPNQTYPNCIFGNKYKIKYPKIDENLRRGLSTYKLNNRLHKLFINKEVLETPENIEKPITWMNHIEEYKIHFKSSTEGWSKYCEIRGEINSTLKCKLFGQIYNNPLDLIEVIAEEIKKKAVVRTKIESATTTTSSSSEEKEISSEQNEEEEEEEEEEDESSVNSINNEDPFQSSTKSSGGRCMDLLKALYKFIYTVSLQVWVMVHNRFLARTSHNQSNYEYVFFLIPKDEIKDCEFIIQDTRCENMKRYREVMIQSPNDLNSEEVVKYILSLSASEFLACSLRFIIDTLKSLNIVTTKTETDQILYATSITNVCMLNSITLAGMQSVPINDEFISHYNLMLAEKEGHPEDTIYVAQKFDKHFQFKMKVCALKRVKFKNEFAFPVFISGVFFSPDRPLNRVCELQHVENNKDRFSVNVIRSYFTYGTYFTPNSHVVCSNLPSVDIQPSYLTKRCSYWYSMDKKSYLMYLSFFNPQDDVDSCLSDLDLCAVSELEWSLCMNEIKPFALLKSQLEEVLFNPDIKLYSACFWPVEYNALEKLCQGSYNWPQNPLLFYVLYMALTKLIADESLLSAYNIKQEYKNNDHVIMYTLFKCFKWKNVFECIQTLRTGRERYKAFLVSELDPSKEISPQWNPRSYEANLYSSSIPRISIHVCSKHSLEPYEINIVFNLSLLYLLKDESYLESEFATKFNSTDSFELSFPDREDNQDLCKSMFDMSTYYHGMKGCALSQQENKLVIYEGGFTNLLEWVSLYLIIHFFQYKAGQFFALSSKDDYKLLPVQPSRICVEEVRECLSFQSTIEYKKILNLEPIYQSYKHLSESEIDQLPYKTEEYIRLLDIKNNLELRPELRNPEQLAVFNNVIQKMSRKRNREHMEDLISDLQDN